MRGEGMLTIGALMSSDRQYRFLLWRRWNVLLEGRRVGRPLDRHAMFVCLNPSTADEAEDDPTVRRLIGYAKAWGHNGLFLVNLCPIRAASPKKMFARLLEMPVWVRDQNQKTIEDFVPRSQRVVAAWGANGSRLKSETDWIGLIGNPPLQCFRYTKSGEPAHPLYLPGYLWPQPYRRPEVKG